MTHQPLWVILCHLPEKVREEIVEEMNREERGTGMRKRRNKNIPPLPLPVTRKAGLAQLLSQYQLDAPMK